MGGAKDLDDHEVSRLPTEVSIIGRRRLLISGHGKLMTSLAGQVHPLRLQRLDRRSSTSVMQVGLRVDTPSSPTA